MSSNKQELLNRWHTFLGKMLQRFDESLQNGREAVLESLAENDNDYYASVRLIHSVRSQIDEAIIRKIESTWQTQVEPGLRKLDGIEWIDIAKQANLLTDELTEKVHWWQFETEGELSHQFYNSVIHSIPNSFSCTQCKAPIAVKKDIFVSHYVDCPYCNSVNTFIPNTKYVQIGWNVLDNMCNYNIQQQYKTAHNWFSDEKSEAEMKEIYQNYLTHFLDEKEKYAPSLALKRDETFNQKMKLRFEKGSGW